MTDTDRLLAEVSKELMQAELALRTIEIEIKLAVARLTMEEPDVKEAIGILRNLLGPSA